MADIEKKDQAVSGTDEEKDKMSTGAIAHLDELEWIMMKNGLEKEDVILVGSAALALCGIRENKDLEFAVVGPKREGFIKRKHGKMNPWSHRAVSENIDLFRNIYGIAGISDKKLTEKELYTVADGWRVAALCVELEFKKCLASLLKREKDAADIIKIEEYALKNGLSLALPGGTVSAADKAWFRFCRNMGRAEDRFRKLTAHS